MLEFTARPLLLNRERDHQGASAMLAANTSGPLPDVTGLGRLLKATGLSREAVAERVGVSADAVNSWCCGRSRVDLRHLSGLALLLSERGIPWGQISDVLVAELRRHGMAEDALRMLRGPTPQTAERPVFLVGSHLNSGSHQLLALGVHTALRATGNAPVVYLDSCGQSEILQYYLTLVQCFPAQGVVIAPAPLPSHELRKIDKAVRQLAAQGIPCVCVNMGLASPGAGLATVQVDNYRAAVVATEVLWSQGHRGICAIGADTVSHQRERADGYCDALKQRGGAPHVVWTLAPSDAARPSAVADRPDSRVAAEMAVGDASVSAILALNAETAKAVVVALRARGRTPGRDASMMTIGCWDWMHDVAFPPITHVALPYYEAGQQAARLLRAMAGGGIAESEGRVVVSPTSDAIHAREAGSIAHLA